MCPRCKSNKINPVVGGIAGLYGCEDCGYTSTIFPVIEIKEKKSKAKKKA